MQANTLQAADVAKIGLSALYHREDTDHNMAPVHEAVIEQGMQTVLCLSPSCIPLIDPMKNLFQDAALLEFICRSVSRCNALLLSKSPLERSFFFPSQLYPSKGNFFGKIWVYSISI